MTLQAPANQIACKRLTVILIKPSKYDDEGCVIRHFRGILPSNTLACLSSLTDDLKRRSVLGRNLENYWNILRNFIWYKNSVHIEGGHPMIHGLFRIKDRTDRRRGFPIESRLRHAVRRFHDVRSLLRRWIALVLEMEELWLQTRTRSEAELHLIFELKRARREVNRNLRTAELQLAHYRAEVHVPDLRVPSRLWLAFRDLNLNLARRMNYSRADMQKFWNKTYKSWRRRKILLICPHKVFLNFLRDAQLILLFAIALLRSTPDS